MKLSEFTRRLRDDAARFRVHLERARARHPEMFSDEYDELELLRMFIIWRDMERGKAPKAGHA